MPETLERRCWSELGDTKPEDLLGRNRLSREAAPTACKTMSWSVSTVLPEPPQGPRPCPPPPLWGTAGAPQLSRGTSAPSLPPGPGRSFPSLAGPLRAQAHLGEHRRLCRLRRGGDGGRRGNHLHLPLLKDTEANRLFPGCPTPPQQPLPAHPQRQTHPCTAESHSKTTSRLGGGCAGNRRGQGR